MANTPMLSLFRLLLFLLEKGNVKLAKETLSDAIRELEEQEKKQKQVFVVLCRTCSFEKSLHEAPTSRVCPKCGKSTLEIVYYEVHPINQEFTQFVRTYSERS